jgi:ribosomal protein L33
MREKIKKILRTIVTIIAILWIFGEIAFKESWEEPRVGVIIGVLAIWGIIMYSLRINKQINDQKGIKFCQECGAKLVENGKFCPQCGKKIK